MTNRKELQDNLNAIENNEYITNIQNILDSFDKIVSRQLDSHPIITAASIGIKLAKQNCFKIKLFVEKLKTYFNEQQQEDVNRREQLDMLHKDGINLSMDAIDLIAGEIGRVLQDNFFADQDMIKSSQIFEYSPFLRQITTYGQYSTVCDWIIKHPKILKDYYIKKQRTSYVFIKDVIS